MVDPEHLVNKKAEDYGHPLDFCATVREAWDVLMATPHRSYHGAEEEPSEYDRAVEHCLYQVLGKMVRVLNNPTHLDSIQDIAGYAQCLELCLDRVSEKPQVSVIRSKTKTYQIKLNGQFFSVTPEEMDVYRRLVSEGVEPEHASRAVYDRILRGVGL